ncbi:T9SS type B sorting domain-containing protein [Flagellimonas nanhaiensis]|uniref:PKD domain-containing protein n=1 Tax=Flagellimonas nanhaiensis TaxID=2292706 RepID=A0A371JSJ1_9FLAO|nr:T9SS type B sorting domain-containing protein [Allomuricauda nanhaiensis]RDY60780.1 PKD domain-containing protein [Allomuricauda nanhaiensis]
MIKWCLLGMLVLGTLPVMAQKQAAIWYFGRNAGLDFNSGSPLTLTNGALSTQEGCATISDASGNLLFYTDGITVWNRNHLPMPNGAGLLGHPSSTQSGIIVPSPANTNIFFVFTVDEAGESNGLQYNIVDMTLDGGLGDVTTKNVPLATPVTEKLTAVEHANGTDIWVLSHRYGSDEFLAYLVTGTGLNTTPVVSGVGISHPILYNGQGVRGYLKVSPDGQFLASASAGTVHTELFRFDSSTGQVSSPILLDSFFPPPPLFGGNNPYGIEFSPDSSKLYVGNTVSTASFTFTSTLYQFDMGIYDQTTIINSGLAISPPKNGETGALQLAIDGKIYVAHHGESSLAAINDPNLSGLACNYQDNVVSLGVATSALGLPPFIQSYFLVGFSADNLCLGDATEFNVTSSEPILSIAWDFGDGNTSTLENPTHTYATIGTYTVTVTVTTASDTATEVKDIVITDTPVANAPLDIEICLVDAIVPFDFSSKDSEVLGVQSATDFSVSYHPTLTDAQLGSNALAVPYTNMSFQETIYARISSIENPSCYDVTNFDILLKQAPILNVVDDWTACDDDGDDQYAFNLSIKDSEILNGQDASIFTITYHGSQTDADNGTNALGTNYTNTLPNETLFFRIENATYPECFETGSFNIEVIGQVVANTPNDLEICDDNNDANAIFDLSLAETEVIGGQNPSNLVISYHDSQADADASSNPLPIIYPSTQYQKIIYVRVANISDNSCYDTTSFQLNIFDTPVAPALPDWLVCDDDNNGQFLFDLSQKADEILTTVSGSILSFYESQMDAELDQNPVAGNYTNIVNPQTIYFRLENNNQEECFDIGQFELQVLDSPTAQVPTDIVICDTDETGTYSFNLSQKDAEVLNGQDSAIYGVTYHTSELDALNKANPVSKNSYQNTDMYETLYARVEHNQLGSCYDITSFDLSISTLPQLNLEGIYVICPDNPDLIIDPGNFESYSWQDGLGNNIGSQRILQIADLGSYQLTVTQTTNGITCENATFFEVVSSGAPESFEISTSGFSDNIEVTVSAEGIGDFEYSMDGVNYQSNNKFEVFPGKYTVYVRDLYGCRTLNQEVTILGFRRFFTPNGDGFHENWNIVGADDYPNSKLYIYDRYGKLLQQVSPQGIGWNGEYMGRPLPASDYWFKFEYGEGEVFTGHFTLKR